MKRVRPDTNPKYAPVKHMSSLRVEYMRFLKDQLCKTGMFDAPLDVRPLFCTHARPPL